MLALLQEALIIKINKSINSVLHDLISLNTKNSVFVANFKRLHGKIIKIQLKNMPVIFNDAGYQYYIDFTEHDIKISQGFKPSNFEYDLLIILSLSGLINAQFTSMQNAIHHRDLELLGDVSLAMTLQSLFDNTEFNLKEHIQDKLAKNTSDLFAWQFVNVLEKIINILLVKKDEVSEQITDYLQVEKNILVNKYEINWFYQEVDRLRDDVDRLTARINLL